MFFFPLYIHTDNPQSSKACINKKTMMNEEKRRSKHFKKTHTDGHFWQSRNKSDKKHNLWFDPYLVSFLFPVLLIGSDCPSQSRDAILVAMETSSASAVRRCSVCQRPPSVGRLERRRMNASGQPEERCQIPLRLQGSRIHTWLNVFHKTGFFILMWRSVNSGTLVCFFAAR